MPGRGRKRPSAKRQAGRTGPEYTSNPADARLIAGAHYVITNGAGYDAWADKLPAANPADARKRLDVATLLGLRWRPIATASLAITVTTNLKKQASGARIPIVGISESLQPPGASFQDWQVRQLDALTRALSATAGHP